MSEHIVKRVQNLLDKPREEWTDGQLCFETAAQLDHPFYICMHEHERRERGWSASREERVAFVKRTHGL